MNEYVSRATPFPWKHVVSMETIIFHPFNADQSCLSKLCRLKFYTFGGHGLLTRGPPNCIIRGHGHFCKLNIYSLDIAQ
jgi:hypothetical protein